MRLMGQKVICKGFLPVMMLVLLISISVKCFSQPVNFTPPDYKNSFGVRVTQFRIGATQTQPLKYYDALLGFGVSYDRKLTRLIHIESGLYYLRKQLDFDSSPTAVFPYEFYNLRLPILFKLSTTYLYSTIGFNLDYMFKYSFITDFYNYHKVDNDFDFKPFVLGGSLNAGVQIPVIERFLLNIEAGITQDITTFFTPQYHFPIKFSGYGYSAGMSYKF